MSQFAFYRGNKHFGQKQLGEKGLIWLTHPRSQSIIEGSQGGNLEAGTEMEVMQEHCLLACSPQLAQPSFSDISGLLAKGVATPIVGRQSLLPRRLYPVASRQKCIQHRDGFSIFSLCWVRRNWDINPPGCQGSALHARCSIDRGPVSTVASSLLIIHPRAHSICNSGAQTGKPM